MAFRSQTVPCYLHTPHDLYSYIFFFYCLRHSYDDTKNIYDKTHTHTVKGSKINHTSAPGFKDLILTSHHSWSFSHHNTDNPDTHIHQVTLITNMFFCAFLLLTFSLSTLRISKNVVLWLFHLRLSNPSSMLASVTMTKKCIMRQITVFIHF